MCGDCEDEAVAPSWLHALAARYCAPAAACAADRRLLLLVYALLCAVAVWSVGFAPQGGTPAFELVS